MAQRQKRSSHDRPAQISSIDYSKVLDSEIKKSLSVKIEVNQNFLCIRARETQGDSQKSRSQGGRS